MKTKMNDKIPECFMDSMTEEESRKDEIKATKTGNFLGIINYWNKVTGDTVRYDSIPREIAAVLRGYNSLPLEEAERIIDRYGSMPPELSPQVEFSVFWGKANRAPRNAHYSYFRDNCWNRISRQLNMHYNIPGELKEKLAYPVDDDQLQVWANAYSLPLSLLRSINRR